VKLHPLEKIAKHHFGVTDSLEETGYVLSDGTFLDLSGRHMANGYEPRGDRFVPKKRQPDYLYGQRSIDHRQLPSEILDAVGTREGSAAMFAFLRETGALRLMPGAGFLVAKMPTIESVDRVVREWHHAFGNEPLYVDVVSAGSRPDRASRVINPGDVRESQEFERPTTEEVMEFLEGMFGGASMGAARHAPAALRIAEVGAFKRRSQEDMVRRMAALIEILELDPDFAHRKKKFETINLVDGRDFLRETDVYDMVIVHSVLSPSVGLVRMPGNKELMTSPDHTVEVWVNRLVSTGAKYIVVCEGQPYTLSGRELGDLPGYDVVKSDERLTVYKNESLR
jgi:hypothetical protein